MAQRGSYIPTPYAARERYVADTGRLGQLIGLQGASQREMAGTQAEIVQRKWASLAQAFSNFVDQRQAKQLATAALAQEQAKLQASEQLRRDEMAALERERQADRAAQQVQERRFAAQDARQAGDALGGQLSPGAITEPQLDVLSGSPAQAARTRYHFGPGTAEGPELLPTAEQAELATLRKAVEEKGGILGPNGQIVMPPRPAVSKSLQRETAIVNGRPQFVNFNPEDGTYQDLQGNPVTPTPVPPREPVSGEPLEAVIGADGNPILLPRSQARGMRPATTREQPTEDERKSAGFYRQMQEAMATLDEVENDLSEKDLYQIQSLPQEELMGLANRGQMSEAAKRYLRAFEQFTEARMRPVSGAAISDSEFARDRRTYAKQFAETPAVAKDRKAARTSALEALKSRASRALPKDAERKSAPKVDVDALIKKYGGG